MGPWKNTTSYPVGIRSESCAAAGGDIYCIGGYSTSAMTDSVYFATLSATGVSTWTKTTSYPFPVWTQSCAASELGIYCIGGSTPTQSTVADVYYSPFTSSGLGAWGNASSYPVDVKQQSCVATTSDIYCIGGYLDTSVYYAAISQTGLSTWTNTTGYPFTVGANLASCVIVGEWVFCVGGHTGSNVSSDVYRAPIYASGVGGWVNETSYPVGLWGESCVTSGGQVYCVGGETQSGSILNGAWYSS